MHQYYCTEHYSQGRGGEGRGGERWARVLGRGTHNWRERVSDVLRKESH
jgi:hypothetical protein